MLFGFGLAVMLLLSFLKPNPRHPISKIRNKNGVFSADYRGFLVRFLRLTFLMGCQHCCLVGVSIEPPSDLNGFACNKHHLISRHVLTSHCRCPA